MGATTTSAKGVALAHCAEGCSAWRAPPSFKALPEAGHLELDAVPVHEAGGGDCARAGPSAHYRDEVRRKECDPDYEIQSWN